MPFDATQYGKASWSIQWVGLHKGPKRGDRDGGYRLGYTWWLNVRGPNYRLVYIGPVRVCIPRPWSLSRVHHDGWTSAVDQIRGWTEQERRLRLGPGPRETAPIIEEAKS